MVSEVVALSSSDRMHEDTKSLGCDDCAVSSNVESLKKLDGISQLWERQL